MNTPLGRHLILECYGCNKEHLNDVENVERWMLEAARAADATVLKSVFHPFYPHGISGVVVIAESHLTIHTWPEFGYAAIDVFTCGDEAKPELACRSLAESFLATSTRLVEVKRGEFARSPSHLVGDSTVQTLPLEAH